MLIVHHCKQRSLNYCFNGRIKPEDIGCSGWRETKEFLNSEVWNPFGKSNLAIWHPHSLLTCPLRKLHII